jgi:STE24 endopeptidase
MEINGYFIFIAITVIGFYLLDVFSNFLNLKALKPELPAEFDDVYDAEKYAKSQAYTRETTKFGMLEATFSLIVFLLFWWLGGFQWLEGLARGFGQGPIVTGLIFVAAMVVAGQILSLPFNLYDTFVIEEKYGFNKTTGKTYATDFVKNLFLSAALGLPIFSLLLYLFQNPSFGNIAWLVAWIATTIFQLIILFIYPKWILPLFNEFKPLEDQELKDGIETMAKKCDFPLTGIFEMDGSKRSTKSNAYFAGFGKHKKIALFDTLIKKHSVPELVAVLAHEIGHFKKKHILKTLILGILQMGVIFYLLGLFLNNRSLFDAFGVQETSVYLSFIFFSFLLSPLSKLIGVGMAIFSRKNEFEADAFAVDVTGSATPLITALKSLSEDNLSNLTPHPFYVFINYSHPPMTERLAALRALA